MKLFLAFTLAISGQLFAQAQAPAPRFEAASVKAAEEAPQGVWYNGGLARLMNMSLKSITAFFYGVKDYLIYGPAWMESERFTIIARLPNDAATLPDKQKRQQIRLMGQALLADRFHLALHEETRPIPVYKLVAAKDGVKLKNLDPEPGDNVRLDYRSGHLSATKMPMSQFLEILNGGLTDLPVVNGTEIQGTFDITLDGTPEKAAASDQLESKPPLFLALQDLGLKLEARKNPMKVLVIDHADKTPVEN